MKKTLFCLAATCMFAVSGLAQTGSSATSSGTQATTTEQQSTSKKAQSTKEKTLTGCIEAGSEANEYVLKTGSSKKPIELISSDDLKPHVGHTVKVTGNWSSEASEKKEMGGGTEQGQHKEAAGKRHFKAEKVDMVSDTCTVGKTSESKSQTPKS
jgi:hypothetical protein